jgi:hypothetical protein
LKESKKDLKEPNVITAIRKKGYDVFEDDDKPFNLNIVAVRSNDPKVNVFNDHMHLCWKYRGQWNDFNFPITCDSGLYWLNNPLSKLGTAIVKEGQYKGLWKTGLHRGKYFALVQKNPVTVIRDYNKDNFLNYDSGRIEQGNFGINHHRAGGVESFKVGKWSAGCLVNPHPRIFEIEMEIFRESAKIWGDSFTLTLIKESDL